MVSNGTGRTYRYYAGPHTRYAFGYGLSYTRFNYSGLVLTPSTTPGNVTVTVSVVVTNVGDVAGKDATQVGNMPDVLQAWGVTRTPSPPPSPSSPPPPFATEWLRCTSPCPACPAW
jgi:hypothetical protein